jgi:hypothetical protein
MMAEGSLVILSTLVIHTALTVNVGLHRFTLSCNVKWFYYMYFKKLGRCPTKRAKKVALNQLPPHPLVSQLYYCHSIPMLIESCSPIVVL